MATEGDSKKLSDLRVVDLRAELEKRGLDKTGVKANLIERLQKALESEGLNPDEYQFETSEKKPAKRLSVSNRSDDQGDISSDQGANEHVLVIETPTDNIIEQVEESNSGDKKNENIVGESPLNLSICEEDENLLLISGDENDHALTSSHTEKDEKTAANDNGADFDRSIQEETNAKQKEDEGTREKQVAKSDSVATASSKHDDSTATNASSATATGSSSTINSSQSDNENSKSDKEKNNKNGKSNNPGRSLWVTNLLPSTKAQELKHLLSRYGKVIGAKVVQSSRYPRTRCYGYVTMETRAAADVCIEKLNNTELKGQIIRVAKVRPEHSLPLKTTKKTESAEKSKRKSPIKQDKIESPEKSDKNKNSAEKKKEDPKIKKVEKDYDQERTNSRSSSRRARSLSKLSGHRDRKSDILTFDKIREERERQRQRERERALREEEKRRREVQRAREIEKRQREEAIRLEREREKLRIERERLDRQRVEIIRLERERQRIEREKLEQEKQELRRQQMRLEEARRPLKRPASSSSSYRRDSSSYNEERKRLVTDRHYEETPPPPRFDVTSRDSAPELTNKKEINKDYKSRISYSKRGEEYSKRSEFKRDYTGTERHSSGHTSHIVHGITGANNSSYTSRDREREMREQNRRETIVSSVQPPRISKETRYTERTGERSPLSYRPVRDDRERHPVTEHHSKSDIRPSREHRYGEPSPTMKESNRYRESNSWHSSGTLPTKQFGGISGSGNSSRDSWNKPENWRPMEGSSNERWIGNSSSRIIITGSSGIPNTIFSSTNSGMSGISGTMTCPPPPGNSSYTLERFDNYKSVNNSRKY